MAPALTEPTAAYVAAPTKAANLVAPEPGTLSTTLKPTRQD
jgi:hypothetical protein